MSKKVLQIELEEECISCPMLELETFRTTSGANMKPMVFHRCKHLTFCQKVRENWEKVRASDVRQ